MLLMRFYVPLAALALLAFQAEAQTVAPTAGQTGTPAAPMPTQTAAPSEPGKPAHHKRMTLAERFEQANTTHDGHLTPDQAKAAGMKNIVRRFDAIDKDHKGYVTEDDIRSYYKALRASRHAGSKHEAAKS
jgi:hypothetical protein